MGNTRISKNFTLVIKYASEKIQIKKKHDFKKVYTQGKTIVGRLVVIYYKRSDHTKIGFSVSKKVGNAVVRNKVKRILREICRNNIELFSSDYNFIFIARPKIKGFSYQQVEKEIIGKLRKVES